LFFPLTSQQEKAVIHSLSIQKFLKICACYIGVYGIKDKKGIYFESRCFQAYLYIVMKPGRFHRVKAKSMLLLATAMLFKAFLAPAVFIDFKLNQDYISKVLCINRDKPELECDGHCILMDKMKSTQDADSPEQAQGSQSHLIEIFSDLTALFQPLSFPAGHEQFYTFNDRMVLEGFSEIFCPPKIS
jgi:hypothetical protein